MPIINVLNEVYFGDEILKTAQSFLSKFRAKYIGKAYTDDINKDKDLFRLQRNLEAVFGFYHLNLRIEQDYDFNAASYSLSQRAAVDKGITDDFTKEVKYAKDKTGFKYNGNNKYIVILVLTYGFVCDDRFSDREVMAAILHEIGHNFSGTFIKKDICNIIQLVVKNIQGIYGIFCYNEKFKKKLEGYEKGTAEYNQKMNELIEGILYGAATFNNKVAIKFANEFLYAQQRLGLEPEDIKKSLINLSDAIKDIDITYPSPSYSAISMIGRVGELVSNQKIKREDEKFANTFASMYGYGKEIGSLGLKIDKSQPLVKAKPPSDSRPIQAVIFDLISMPFKVLGALSDPHEGSLDQAKTQMEYLKWEIKKLKLDSDTRKELQDQYNYLREEIRPLINIDNQENGSKLRNTYNKYLYTYFKRDYARVLSANERFFDNIDKVSKRLEESSVLIEMADPNYTDLEM